MRIAVVDRVGHPSCGLLLDTFHMNIEEQSIGDALRSAGSRLKHLHACENDRGAPGSGHVPWTEVAQALRDIRYNDGVVIESFTSKVKSIARAAAIWRPLAATQDALAENGLRHLRGLLLRDDARSRWRLTPGAAIYGTRLAGRALHGPAAGVGGAAASATGDNL